MAMMEDIVKIFRSPEGDVYHITLSEHTGVLSDKVVNSLNGICVVDIELRRLSGCHVTNHKVLLAIEDTIADLFLQRDDLIICYYCDFINPIPRTLKNTMPVQEYRSRLFARMFERYTQQRHIDDIRLSVVEINGSVEKYYFHVIYREAHSLLATIIGHDLKEGFDK